MANEDSLMALNLNHYKKKKVKIEVIKEQGI